MCISVGVKMVWTLTHSIYFKSVLQKVPLMTADDKDVEAELNQDTSKEEE